MLSLIGIEKMLEVVSSLPFLWLFFFVTSFSISATDFSTVSSFLDVVGFFKSIFESAVSFFFLRFFRFLGNSELTADVSSWVGRNTGRRSFYSA